AELFNNNTFAINGHKFFVATANNLYIVPDDTETHNEYFYSIAKAGGGTRNHIKFMEKIRGLILKEINILSGKVTKFKQLQADGNKTQEQVDTEQNKLTAVQDASSQANGLSKEQELIWIKRHPLSGLNIKKINTEFKRLDLSKRTEIEVDKTHTGKYAYHIGEAQSTTQEGKDMLINWPTSITSNNKKMTTFAAAMLVEPSRWTVSHISNLLLTHQKAKSADEIGKENRMYEHTSMTRSGSDEGTKANAEAAATAGDLGRPDPRLDPALATKAKMITDRDIASVKDFNPQLAAKLKSIFEASSESKDDEIIVKFVLEINKYLRNTE
ncbi:MAG: hypothetical protein AAFY76_11440, partial [Cyanobacteria bacterium J06649_11]